MVRTDEHGWNHALQWRDLETRAHNFVSMHRTHIRAIADSSRDVDKAHLVVLQP